MSQAIELSDESVALLRQQAAAHGLSVDEWILAFARERANLVPVPSTRQNAQAAAARIRDIQKRVKPDPEGWTIRDYIEHGRP